MKTTNNNIFMLLILLFTPFISPAQDFVNETPNILLLHTKNAPTLNHKTVKEGKSVEKKAKITNSLKTSQGKDFFNYFVELSELNNLTHPLDLVILENYRESSYNTVITIFAHKRLLYKFRTLENKEYLYAAAQESIKRLKKFYAITNEDVLVEK